MTRGSDRAQTGSEAAFRSGSPHKLYLIFALGERVCALPVSYVSETMRPLPIEPLHSAPPYVLGMAMIRGATTPVLDTNALLGATRTPAPGRFITLKGDNSVALAVDSVLGVRALPQELRELPPLIREALPDFVTKIGELDARLLLVLESACVLPERIWQTLEAAS